MIFLPELAQTATSLELFEMTQISFGEKLAGEIAITIVEIDNPRRRSAMAPTLAVMT